MGKKNVGSGIDDFLKEEGIFTATQTQAVNEVLAWQLAGSIKDAEVQRSSDNVFADLGIPDADKLKIKAGLVIEIRKAMRQRNLTQQEAAQRMGLTLPKVAGMMRGDFSNFSERKLIDCLARLR